MNAWPIKDHVAGLGIHGLAVRCQLAVELIELEPARFDDQTHGCGASRNKIELQERALATRSCSGKPRTRASDRDRKSTRLNSSHVEISYAVFCLKKKKMSHTT